MTTPDIQSLVESVLRLDKEATKGPWRAYVNGGIYASDEESGEKVAECFEPKRQRLIAEYRSAAPILATEVLRLRAELAEEKRKAEDLVPFLRRFVQENPKHEYRGVMQDPCGAHALLAALTTPSEGGETK